MKLGVRREQGAVILTMTTVRTAQRIDAQHGVLPQQQQLYPTRIVARGVSTSSVSAPREHLIAVSTVQPTPSMQREIPGTAGSEAARRSRLSQLCALQRVAAAPFMQILDF